MIDRERVYQGGYLDLGASNPAIQDYVLSWTVWVASLDLRPSGQREYSHGALVLQTLVRLMDIACKRFRPQTRIEPPGN